MKICLAPDSFKGSLTAKEVCECMEKGINRVISDAQIIQMPLADGGEGTMEVLMENLSQAQIRTCLAYDALGREISTEYCLFQEECCLIEVAKIIGLPMISKEDRDILKTTSKGVGTCLLDALDQNCQTIYITLGGSASNDAGIGLLSALGAEFYDDAGILLEPTTEAIQKIKSVDFTNLDKRLENVTIIALCDVDNVLFGEKGATYTFGAQKGATPQMQKELDQSIQQFVQLLNKQNIHTYENNQGSGAAGGLGFALNSILHAEIVSGIEEILKILDAEKKIQDVDFVITGEGRIDKQTLNGKVPVGIARLARQFNVPAVAVAGYLGEMSECVFEDAIAAIESCIYEPCSVEEAIEKAKENVTYATERLVRSILVGYRLK